MLPITRPIHPERIDPVLATVTMNPITPDSKELWFGSIEGP